MDYTKKSLVIVMPIYNEGKAIRKNFADIYNVLKNDGISCRFLLVDDGSIDETWKEITSITTEYQNVEALRFARNFGKEVALLAGIDSIDADSYIIMDSDLQHPPRYIKQMLELMDRENADIVEGIKKTRGKESLKYRIVAKGFYKLFKGATGLDFGNSSDFKIINRNVIDTLRRFQERNVFFRGLVGWVGYKSAPFYFEVDERLNGVSSFSTKSLFKFAINSILSYTSKPLYLTIAAGILFMFFAVILGIQTLYNFFSGHAVSGFSTVILLLLIIGSIIMLSLGIIGVYISRIFDEIKGRPKYIISERI